MLHFFKKRFVGLIGLLPLLPLTQNGTNREVIEQCIAGLTPLGQEPKTELLTLTYGLASLAFEDEADQEWLIRRFAKMYDMLRETRAFQEIIREGLQEGLEKGYREGLEKGMEKGMEKGVEKGRQEGEVEALRKALFNIVQIRFPQLGKLTKGLASITESADVLNDMLVKMSTVQTLEEAQHYLIKVSEEQ